MSNEKTYKTSDMYLAAFLELSGFYAGLKQVKGRRFEFGFTDSEEMQDFVKAFYAKQSKVEPMEFANKMRQLKGRMLELAPMKKHYPQAHRKFNKKSGGGGQNTPASPQKVAGDKGATPEHRT